MPALYQGYHPYACHTCKRGPFTNGTPLLTCTRCKVVRYCCVEHQKLDFGAHKKWCRAFAAVREEENMARYEDRAAWSAAVPVVVQQLVQKMNMERHSTDIQIATMQPRCRKCYVAGWATAKLTPCPRCCGVALCGDCLPDDATQDNPVDFHCDSTSDPMKECDGHRMVQCCLGMVVEQGSPLAIPSQSDSPTYWNPQDWVEYFERKRTDYELPEEFFLMAPVACFLSDAHSTMLTLQHVVALPELAIDDVGCLEDIVIHVCGASGFEFLGVIPKCIEFSRMNPQLKRLTLRLVGPDMEGRVSPSSDSLRMMMEQENVRTDCEISITYHGGFYHTNTEILQEEPTIVICPHSGLEDHRGR